MTGPPPRTTRTSPDVTRPGEAQQPRRHRPLDRDDDPIGGDEPVSRLGTRPGPTLDDGRVRCTPRGSSEPPAAVEWHPSRPRARRRRRRKAPEDHVEHTTARREDGIELDTADEGSEEPVHHRGAEPLVADRVGGVDVLTAEELRHGRRAKATAQGEEPELVQRCAHRCHGRRQEPAGPAERVADRVEPVADPDQSARLERSQSERHTVELPVQLGVGGEHDLEAAVDQESVDLVGAHSSADLVGCLDDDDLTSGCLSAPWRRRGRPARRRPPRPRLGGEPRWSSAGSRGRRRRVRRTVPTGRRAVPACRCVGFG